MLSRLTDYLRPKGLFQWRIQGRGPGGPAPLPPLFLDQSEAQVAEKFWGETAPPPPPTPYLKVWIRHRIFEAVEHSIFLGECTSF